MCGGVKTLNFWVEKMESIGDYKGMAKLRRLMGGVLNAVLYEYPEYKSAQDATPTDPAKMYRDEDHPKHGKMQIYPNDLDRLMMDAKFDIGDEVKLAHGGIFRHTITGRGLTVYTNGKQPLAEPLSLVFMYELDGNITKLEEKEILPYYQ